MPYIDFCFMLIIIFVGMLSIAYFEPLGKTDIETKNTPDINQTVGRFEVKPIGIQESKIGVGEETKVNELRPLVGRTGVADAARAGVKPAAQSIVNPGLQPASQGNQTATGSGINSESYINPEELDKLKEELAARQAEIEKLKATQKEGTGGTQPPSTGKGDSYYIDLRPK